MTVEDLNGICMSVKSGKAPAYEDISMHIQCLGLVGCNPSPSDELELPQFLYLYLDMGWKLKIDPLGSEKYFLVVQRPKNGQHFSQQPAPQFVVSGG